MPSISDLLYMKMDNGELIYGTNLEIGKYSVKHDCECGNSCCSVNESTQDKIRAEKKFRSLMRQEGNLRDRMFKLEQAFLADARPENVKLAKELKKLYKS